MASIKKAGYYDAEGNYLGDTLPEGYKEVGFDSSRHKLPDTTTIPGQFSKDKVVPLGMSLGGALLGHSIASSLFDGATEREKSRRSLWEKLVSALLPLAAGGAGAYGGYLLGDKLVKASEDREAYSNDTTYAWPWFWGTLAGGGALGTGIEGWNTKRLFNKWLEEPEKVLPDPGPYDAKIQALEKAEGDLYRGVADQNRAIDTAYADDVVKWNVDRDRLRSEFNEKLKAFNDEQAQYLKDQDAYLKSQEQSAKNNVAHNSNIGKATAKREKLLTDRLKALTGTDRATMGEAKAIREELAKLEQLRGKASPASGPTVSAPQKPTTQRPAEPTLPQYPKRQPYLEVDQNQLRTIRDEMSKLTGEKGTAVINPAKAKALRDAMINAGGTATAAAMAIPTTIKAFNSISDASALKATKDRELDIVRKNRQTGSK